MVSSFDSVKYKKRRIHVSIRSKNDVWKHYPSYDHTCNNTLARKRNVIVTMRFLFENLFILKAIEAHFIGSYDKENLTLAFI